MIMPLQVSLCSDPTSLTIICILLPNFDAIKCLLVITLPFSSGILAVPFSITLIQCNLHVIYYFVISFTARKCRVILKQFQQYNQQLNYPKLSSINLKQRSNKKSQTLP